MPMPWEERIDPLRRPDYKVFLYEDGGAYVLAIHKDGRQETWVGFATEDEAEAWVIKERAEPSPQCKNGTPAPG